MKRALTILAALMLAGCGQDELTGAIYPTGTLPTPEQRTILHGMVVNEDGECIRGATVQIEGQWGGEALEQRTPCAIGIFGEDVGFTVEDVIVGVGLTVRSSAPGYETAEQMIFPLQSPLNVVFLTLRRSVELPVADR